VIFCRIIFRLFLNLGLIEGFCSLGFVLFGKFLSNGRYTLKFGVILRKRVLILVFLFIFAFSVLRGINEIWFSVTN